MARRMKPIMPQREIPYTTVVLMQSPSRTNKHNDSPLTNLPQSNGKVPQLSRKRTRKPRNHRQHPRHRRDPVRVNTAVPPPQVLPTPAFTLNHSIGVSGVRSFIGPAFFPALGVNAYFITYRLGDDLTKDQKWPWVVFPEPGKTLKEFITVLRLRHGMQREEVIRTIEIVSISASIMLNVESEGAEADWQNLLSMPQRDKSIFDLLFSTIEATNPSRRVGVRATNYGRHSLLG